MNNKPHPPLKRMINESIDCGTCPNCSSSLVRKWIFVGKKRCLNPDCSYGKENNND